MSPHHQGAKRADPCGLWQVVYLDRDDDDPRRSRIMECSRQADGSLHMQEVERRQPADQVRAA